MSEGMSDSVGGERFAKIGEKGGRGFVGFVDLGLLDDAVVRLAGGGGADFFGWMGG